jgi:TPR repeat protein
MHLREAAEPPEFALVCPVCLHKNEVRQRFCGFCGFPLERIESDLRETPQAAPELPFVDRSDNGWQWLRERHLQELTSQQKRTSRWIALAIILLFVALASGGLLVWRNRAQLGVSWLSDSPSASAFARKPETLPVVVEEPHRPDLSPAQVVQNSERDAASKNPREAGSATAADSAVIPGSGDAGDEGAQEFVEGRRYLEGQGVARNSALAAAWLWKSVARKNVNAVLLLSDLYAHGDGVPQSCDQARLLLRAAAQKGSAKARHKLLALARMGCP